MLTQENPKLLSHSLTYERRLKSVSLNDAPKKTGSSTDTQKATDTVGEKKRGVQSQSSTHQSSDTHAQKMTDLKVNP